MMKDSLKQYKESLTLGVLGLIFLFLLVGLWAFVIPITGAVIGAGQVSSQQGNRLLQHDVGGRVVMINVEEGDIVEEGQSLIELSTEVSLLKRETLTEQYADLRSRQLYLEARLQNKDQLQKETPKNFTEEELILWKKALANYQTLLTADYEAYHAQIHRIEEGLKAARLQLGQAKIIVKENFHKKDLLQERIESFKILEEKGVAARSQILQLKISLSDIEQGIASSRERLLEIRGRISGLVAELKTLEKQRNNQIQEQLLQVKTALSEVKSQRLHELQSIERSVLRAPIKGKVFNLAVNTIGAVVGSGAILMEIVPEDEVLIVTGMVKAQDIVSVSQGQKAQLRFSAFSISTTPVIEGEVIHISADQAEGNYIIKIKPDQEKLEESHLVISPGMPVEIMLTAGKRTLAQYILKSFSDAISRTFKNPA